MYIQVSKQTADNVSLTAQIYWKNPPDEWNMLNIEEKTK